MPIFTYSIADIDELLVHRVVCDHATADQFITSTLTDAIGRVYDAQLTLDWWNRIREHGERRGHHFNALGITYIIRDAPLTAPELEKAILSYGPNTVTAVQQHLLPAEPLVRPERIIIAFKVASTGDVRA